MEFGPQHIGKWLILAGLIIAGLGVLALVLGRFGVFRLLGDLEFGSRNWRVYFPVASCVLISIIVTFVLWLINYLRR